MDTDDFNEALYAGASATMKTAGYAERGPTTPSDDQIAKFKRQLQAFLAVCPEHLLVADLRELAESR